MKKLIVMALALLLGITSLGYGDQGTLDTPLSLQPDEAVSFDYNWNIGENTDYVTGRHRWRASDNSVIYIRGSNSGGWITWTLRDHQHDSVPGVSNTDCTGPSTPDSCCAGAHPNESNTCDDMADSLNADCESLGQPYSCCTQENQGVCQAWSQTFMFQCGMTNCDNKIIGQEMRNAIFNQWKKIYAPGKNITF